LPLADINEDPVDRVRDPVALVVSIAGADCTLTEEAPIALKDPPTPDTDPDPDPDPDIDNPDVSVTEPPTPPSPADTAIEPPVLSLPSLLPAPTEISPDDPTTDRPVVNEIEPDDASESAVSIEIEPLALLALDPVASDTEPPTPLEDDPP